MASTREWCDRTGEKFDDWWRSPDTEIHHFIGKDITYFHTLFWPGMLKTAGYTLPAKVHIHGFLTVGGEKMSKSKGTFVMGSTYLKHLDPAYLRYYYASKLGPRLDDLDLNIDEFVNKVNADLVGKVVNLASRSARFVEGEKLSARYPEDGGLFAYATAKGPEIADLYEACDYNSAMREIMALADRANKYVEEKEPWTLRKDPAKKEEVRDVCTVILNLFRQLAIYLAPVLPRLAKQTGALLNDPIGPGAWDKSKTPLLGSTVNKFEHMLKRVEKEQVNAMIDDTKEGGASQVEGAAAGASIGAAAPVPSGTSAASDGPEALQKEPLVAAHCTFDDFTKIDMRVARVLSAEDVADSTKLLRLVLSLGGEERRTVLAGIKEVYKPEALVGRLVICCANLEPRKMRFGTSEGMVLASGAGGREIYLLSPDSGAVPGQRVH
jgi:methionyl-tRNA synthetase